MSISWPADRAGQPFGGRCCYQSTIKRTTHKESMPQKFEVEVAASQEEGAKVGGGARWKDGAKVGGAAH